jgi:hypothetical protein
MLGDLIAESTGKRIVRRVLGINPVTVEVTFEDSGNMLGIATTGMGTYTSVIGLDGSIFGEGHGLISTQEGEAVVWKGSGKGKILPGGAISYRGILYYQTTSSKLAKLNAAPGVFEYDIDPEGKTRSKVWEWK